MTIFFINRTTKRFFFGAVASPTSFIILIKFSGDVASFAFGIFFDVVDVATTSFAAVVATGTGTRVVVGDSDTTDDSILGTLGLGGAVPKSEVESTSFPQDSRICSELSALFHLNVPTIPMKTALPAKKFTTADDPNAVAVDVTTTEVDDPDAAFAAVTFAAEIIMLDVVKASAKVGSISKGTPSDLEVVK